VTDRRRVLAAHRPTHHSEPVDIDLVQQFSDVVCPINDSSAGLRIRQTDTRPVGRDQPDADVGCDAVCRGDVEPAGEPPCALTIGTPSPLPYWA